MSKDLVLSLDCGNDTQDFLVCLLNVISSNSDWFCVIIALLFTIYLCVFMGQRPVWKAKQQDKERTDTV